jgi:hypothetical protein
MTHAKAQSSPSSEKYFFLCVLGVPSASLDMLGAINFPEVVLFDISKARI